MYLNVNNPVNYQLQGFGQNGVRTISTDQLYIQGEYYRVLVAEEDSYVTAVSVLGDDLTAEFVYAGTTIYGLFTEVSVTSGSLTAYIAGPTDIEDVWAYINAYGLTNAATIEAADCAKDAIAPLLDKYYAKASLVMVPSLYKTSIVYSERPLTSDGQLAFTRSNATATRVGPDGLIEKVRTNLALYSEDLTNAAYVAQNATLTANTTTAPDGTTTADTYNEGTLSTAHRFYQQFTITANAEYGFSFFAKKNTLDVIRLVVNDLGENFRWFGAQFNLTNGTITATATGSAGGATYIGGSITNVGNGWYRCSVNGTINTTTALCFVHSSTSTAITSTDDRGSISYTGTSRTYFGWGFQFETGVTTDYIATTTAAVSVGMLANVPRLDYLGSTCPRLLLEPQRTNLVTYSEQFDNAAWTKSNASVTANQTTSPSGYDDADLIDALTGTGQHFISAASTTYTNAVPYTFSVFAKKGNTSLIQLFGPSGVFGSNVWATYNFDTLEVTAGSQSTASMVDYGSGWYRLILTGTVTNVAVIASFYAAFTNDKSVRLPSFTAANQTFYLWGAQTEQASYPTSYIPTLGAAVTRGADVTSKSGISSLIGQANGTAQMTFVMDSDTSADTTTMLGIHASTSTANRIQLISRFGGVRLLVIANNSIVSNVLLYDAAPDEVVNVAFKYGSAGVTAYVNGTQVYTTASAVVFTETMTLFTIGNRSGIDEYGKGQRVSQSLLFPTALSNSDLAALTA